MSESPDKLDLQQAAGLPPSSGAQKNGVKTIRIRREDLRAMRRPISKKRKIAFLLVALFIAAALGNVLWFFQEGWLPWWQNALPETADSSAPALPAPVAETTDDAPPAEPPPAAPTSTDIPLPSVDSLTYWSAATWKTESFQQAVRHFNEALDAYRHFLAEDSTSRPLAQAETELIAALQILQTIAPEAPPAIPFDQHVRQARALLAEVRHLAKAPTDFAAKPPPSTSAPPSSASTSVSPRTWKNPDYLEGVRAFNRAVENYKLFFADKTRQSLLASIEADAFLAAKKFEALKPTAPSSIPLQDHITQCYKLISDCRRQHLESGSSADAPSSNIRRVGPSRRPPLPAATP